MRGGYTRSGANYYELDYVTLYNYCKENDVKYGELSEMHGKEKGYISGVLTKNRRVPEEVLEQLCSLIGKTREEMVASPRSVFNTTLEVKPETKPEEEVYVPFEDRMKKMLAEDPERRERFMASEAYQSQLDKGNDVLADITGGQYKDKWERFVDYVCGALKQCKKNVSVVDLVQLMVE